MAVFGGRVIPHWPRVPVPNWLTRGRVAEVCFAAHDEGVQEHEYPRGRYPFGGNSWVRRSVLSPDVRLDGSMGTRPDNRLMGGETSFLMALESSGLGMVYCPDAVVGHRIPAQALRPAAVSRRAFRYGRSRVHWYDPVAPQLLARSRIPWSVLRVASVCRYLARLAWARLQPSPDRRGNLGFAALVRLGRMPNPRNWPGAPGAAHEALAGVRPMRVAARGVAAGCMLRGASPP